MSKPAIQIASDAGPTIPLTATLDIMIAFLAKRAEAAAIVTAQGDEFETWTYAQLALAIEARVRELLGRGLVRGEIVGLLGPNSAAWIAGFLAIVAAGATVMPLDERLDDDELAAQLAGSACRMLIASHQHCQRPALTNRTAPTVLALESPHASAYRAMHDVLAGSSPSQPRDVALLLHTSGTTGTPKAVPLTHANLAANLVALQAEKLIDIGDRVLVPLPLFHAYPIMIGLLVPLAAGATIVFPAGLSGPELVKALRGGNVTHLVGVPRLYEALMQAITARVGTTSRIRARGFTALLGLASALRRRCGLRTGRLILRSIHRQFAPRLRLLVCGGAAIAQDLEERLEDLGWEVLTGYGLTETSPVLSFNRRDAKRAGSAGRAIPGVELRIVEPDAHGVGQIEARGPSIFAGYRGNEEATRRSFTTDGWFRTGDLGSLGPDGFLHIAARVGETIVLADGRKVFPESVETRYAAEPVIREIALLAEGGRLVGLVVPDLAAMRELGAIRAESLIREALARGGAGLPPEAQLTGFAVTREPLPRTHLGKLKRHLLTPILARARQGARPAATEALSPADRALLDTPLGSQLWSWLVTRFHGRPLALDTSPQLDLGIDSMGWVSLTLELQDALGVRLTEDALARVATLRDLLHAALAAPREQPIPTASIAPTSTTRLSPVLEALRRMLHVLNTVVIRGAFTLEVDGIENLPASGAFIVCPNHASYLDPFALGGALPWGIFRRVHWAGWTGILFRNAATRLFSHLAQVIPVDPDRAVTTSLMLGGDVLARGNVLVWFPEGTRSPDGELQEFLPGVAKLLTTHDVPVVPVHISGSFAAWPRHRRWPRRAHVRVRFGRAQLRDELHRHGVGRNDAERVMHGLRTAVATLATR